MGKPFAKVCRDAGVRGVIFFPQAGPKTLEGFVTAAFDAGLTPIVGLVMTHDAYLESEGGYIVDEAPERMAETAVKLGVTDFVLPGTKPEVVKRFAAGALSGVKAASIMMPGIGSQGGSLATAFDAARPHRRFAIIGSAVYGAKDPRAALQGFIREMKNA
jgi:orotidine-5'-phosphate decarboxylase